MKVVIIGAGRMGIRHAQGIQPLTEISEICLVDIYENSLIEAANNIKGTERSEIVKYVLSPDFIASNEIYDVAIIASTAGSRLDTLSNVIHKKVKHVLLEKPLGQSIDEVNKIIEYLNTHPEVQSYVNFSMRLNPSTIQLKNDLNNLPQFKGPKTISINTGAIGIGANGVHLLDLGFFILDADKATISACEIEDDLIPSGRGSQFKDFGGWAVINFYKNDLFVGKLMLSIGATSSTFGPIEIIGMHGRIHYDYVRNFRTDSLREENSDLPVYRYHSDYIPDQQTEVASLQLSELTQFWMKNILENKSVLPSASESLKVHELMFNWLSKSKTHSKLYPIT